MSNLLLCVDTVAHSKTRLILSCLLFDLVKKKDKCVKKDLFVQQ